MKVSAEAAKSRAVQTEAEGDRWSSFHTEAAFLNQLSLNKSTQTNREVFN